MATSAPGNSPLRPGRGPNGRSAIGMPGRMSEHTRREESGSRSSDCGDGRSFPVAHVSSDQPIQQELPSLLTHSGQATHQSRGGW
jgi:hypothetical protein